MEQGASRSPIRAARVNGLAFLLMGTVKKEKKNCKTQMIRGRVSQPASQLHEACFIVL